MECRCDNKCEMMTIKELSKYLDISRAVLYKGVRENSLGIPHIKINKAVRFLKSDVDAWMNVSRKNTGPDVIKCIEESNGNPK